MKKRDLEYLLVDTEGIEEIIFSANTIKEIAKFCKREDSDIRRCYSQKKIFKFENKKVEVISVDLNADYEVKNG